MNPQRSTIAPLTSLRFFAAVYVLVFHSGSHQFQPGRWPEPLLNFLHNGYLGVSFFFVLSGFILTYSYAGGMRSSADVADFAVARFARIYPVYALALLLYLPVTTAPGDDPALAAATLFMLQGWNFVHSSNGTFWNMPAWTLSMELFFYILFPLLLIGTDRMRERWAWVGLVIALSTSASLRLPAHRPDTAWLLAANWIGAIPLPLMRLPEFVAGVFAARLFMRGRFQWMAGDAVALAVVLATVAALASSASPWVSSAAPLLFSGLILAAATNRGRFHSALSTRVMLLLGGASYAIYLLQTAVRTWVTVLFQGNLEWTGRVLYQPALVLLSIGVFLWIEEPTRRALRAWFGQGKVAQAAASVK